MISIRRDGVWQWRQTDTYAINQTFASASHKITIFKTYYLVLFILFVFIVASMWWTAHSPQHNLYKQIFKMFTLLKIVRRTLSVITNCHRIEIHLPSTAQTIPVTMKCTSSFPCKRTRCSSSSRISLSPSSAKLKRAGCGASCVSSEISRRILGFSD